MPVQSRIVIDVNVPVRMRDGVTLHADVYRPAVDGRFPVLLTRTPYDKAGSAAINNMFDLMAAARAGYAVVVQDVRGRYTSEGDWYPFVHEADDGYDTVEWCAAQPWSTGKVGMFGRSYVGATQWLAATTRPPHLICIAPMITADDYHEGWTYQGGAFELGFALSWSFALAADTLDRQQVTLGDSYSAALASYREQLDCLPCRFTDLPLRDTRPVASLDLTHYYRDWIDHPDDDDYWRRWNIAARHATIEVPALNVGGWYDIFLGGTLRNFVGMRATGATPAARDGQRLLVGPWWHAPFSNPTGDAYFGVESTGATIAMDGQVRRWYDYWLKGETNGVDADAPVRLFVMGENAWRSESEWPLARTRYTPYYLRSDGRANSLRGDGVLSLDAPGGDPPDCYVYNPRDPVPTRGGQLCCSSSFLGGGAFDQRPVEERSDVLVYTTPALSSPVEVTGPITVRLWAATSVADTDFTAKLVDVAPDGYARNLTDGIIRARYREGTDRPRPIEPGRAYEYTIDLWATSNLFKAGHRIRLEIASANFPRFDRNLNTGHALGQDAEMQPALQTILHDAEHPSHVILPIIPRG
jgi:uncharacterized protein